MFTCLAVYGVHRAFILFSMVWNGLAGSDVVGKLMRCVAQFVMIIRFMLLLTHIWITSYLLHFTHKKQQKQQKNQPNNNNNNRDKKKQWKSYRFHMIYCCTCDRKQIVCVVQLRCTCMKLWWKSIVFSFAMVFTKQFTAKDGKINKRKFWQSPNTHTHTNTEIWWRHGKENKQQTSNRAHKRNKIQL